ncbi:MAG: hypothetical protein KDD47_25755, partial [Acidobacteria bacterium]|nr:hypothetical protein [Acidobacteriota bacterium]
VNFRALPTGGRLRFSAGGFRDGALPDWNASSPYRCQRLLSGSERWRSIEELLSEAAKKGSKIVVLPELSVDPETLRKLREWLRREHRRHGFSLVVAGSFHLEVEGGDGSRLRRGVASLLDGYGEEILRHTKLRPMRVGTNGEFLEEDIEGGSQVELLHFGFGLLGLAICLDFCEESRVPIKDLWVAIEPALLLVPSMGAESTNNAHHRKAEALARQCGAVTVVASQHPKEPEALGLRWGGKDAKPQRETPILHGVITWPGWDGA